MTTTKTSHRAAARLAADQAYARYEAIKAGRALHEMPEAEVLEAIAAHQEFCELDRIADQSISVRCNVNAVQRAIDSGADEWGEDGQVVRFTASTVYGTPEALLELAGAVDEMAEGSYECAASFAERAVPQTFVDRWVQGAYAQAEKIRQAVAEAV